MCVCVCLVACLYVQKSRGGMHDDDDDGIIWHCLNTVVEEGSGKKRINFTFASSHSTTRSLAFVALASVVAAAASYSHFDLVVEWALKQSIYVLIYFF